MDQRRWEQIEEIFNASLLRPPEERARFVEAACNGDLELQAEVSSLLKEHDRPTEFLEKPVFSLGAHILAKNLSSLAGTTLGNYTIIRPINRGGMGEVFLAHDNQLGRDVAIKLLPPLITENREQVRRFRYEARAASAISHPNVAHVYGIGESNGLIFFAMEFVDGSTLRQMLSAQTIEVGTAIDLVIQIASAIAAAHARGIVHRDIKPENIIIRQADGLVKVVDFGLAKLTETPASRSRSDEHEPGEPGEKLTRLQLTQPGLLMGTARYMSPEQTRGREVDFRTDIWSWAVVSYELFLGTPPFTGETTSDVIAEILKSDPPLLNTSDVTLPGSLKSILKKALSKKKDDRYTDMSEVLDELARLRADLPEYQQKWRLPLQKKQSLHSESLIQTAALDAHQLEPRAQSTIHESSSGNLPRAKPSRRRLWLGLAAILTLFAALAAYQILQKRRIGAAPAGAIQIGHLTNDDHALDAALSADGRLMAYVPIESGKYSLRMRNLQSGQEWQLLPASSTLCWGPRFTPNGLFVFYVTTQPNSTVSVLYRMPVGGGPTQKLVTNIDSPPTISPDGMQMAFIRSYPGQHRDDLILANIDGSAEQELLSRRHPDSLAFTGMAWSHDGKSIAVGAGRGSDLLFAILQVMLSDGSVRELTRWQWLNVMGLAWPNGGDEIVLSARMVGTPTAQIWRLSVPEGSTQRITNDEREYGDITLAQHARQLLTIETSEISNLWSYQANRAQRLTSDSLAGLEGLAVAQGSRIIYTVGREEQSTLWATNLNGSARRQLTQNPGLLPASSPDGRWIVYTSREGGSYHIWLMDSEGNFNHQLTHGAGESFASITPDGNSVVYVARAGERNTLWKIPVSGGAVTQLTTSGIAIRPVVSPDGSQLACTYRTDEADNWKIAILSYADGRVLKTLPLPFPYNQIIRWTPDGKALTYLEQKNGVHNVWQQPLDGSRATQITDFTEDQIFYYDWTAGAQLALSRGGTKRNVVLIKDF